MDDKETCEGYTYSRSTPVVGQGNNEEKCWCLSESGEEQRVVCMPLHCEPYKKLSPPIKIVTSRCFPRVCPTSAVSDLLCWAL